MRQHPEDPIVRLRRAALVLRTAAVVSWLIALALPICVLLLIGSLPGEDPARTERSYVIAIGAFVSFAVLAVPATIGVTLVQRARTRAPSNESGA